MELSTISAIIQVAIIILIAALLHELTRVMALRFLSYWSRGWIALAIGLVANVASSRFKAYYGDGNVGTVLLQMLYCQAEYIFGYCIWLGCRNYHSGEVLTKTDVRTLLCFTPIAIGLPIAFPEYEQLLPCHTAIMACLFVIAAIECRIPAGEKRLVGARVLRLVLYSLTVLFVHYAVLRGWLRHSYPDIPLDHLEYSSLYDATLEVGMAFGMVLLATERVRIELEARNRKLAEASEALRQTAHTDPLTGLLNRLAFEELKGDMSPLGLSGSLAIIDLNDLKPLNDIYGHRVGDIALQIVARSLRIHSRVTDPIYRLGGDEFAIVMPDCSLTELTDRLGQIDEALKGQRIPGLDQPLDIRIAWGCTRYDSPGVFFESVTEADDRMYAQKKIRKGGVRSRDEILV